MVRIDCLIFGYRRLKIEPNDLSLVTSILIRSSVFSSINSDGTITVKEKDFEKIKSLLSGRVDFSFSDPLGLYGKCLRLENKRAIICALAFSLFLTLFLSGVVWDVRVSGNERISADEVIDLLYDSGFGVGDLWLLSDKSAIESDCLAADDRVAWININRRGTVAYVRIIERNNETEPPAAIPDGYSNIVAARTCVIEEITVKRGVAVVKPGDAVKKGDLLVAGILPAESGGGFCHAEASIIGRVADSVTVDMSRNYDKMTYLGRETYSISLNLFNFSINIFKKYGKMTNECDIIDDEITYTHSGGGRLPFSITVSYIPLFEAVPTEYTDDELVMLASDKMTELINEMLSESDLLRIQTEGDFTEGGYRLTSRLIYLAGVGDNIDFTAE